MSGIRGISHRNLRNKSAIEHTALRVPFLECKSGCGLRQVKFLNWHASKEG
jgi:hypothetical protein